MKVRPVFSRIATPTYCPNCGYELEGWHYRTMAIGDPNIVCPNCGVGLELGNVEEWDSEPKLGKVLVGFAYIFTALRYTVIAFGLALISEWIFHFNIFFNQEGNQISPLLPVFLGLVTVVAIVVKTIILKKAVEQSKKRTRSFDYVVKEVAKKTYDELKVKSQNQSSTSDNSNYRK